MRTLVLAAASTALALTACSQGNDTAVDPTTEASPAVETVDATATAEAAGVLDANTATEQQLAGANGMTPEAAKAVVAGRPYKTVVDLNTKLRSNLSQDQAGAVLAGVFVPVNLNSASEEEIKLIPGMTDKMVHEFLEYRPYENMEEFDREIGKYVDKDEVARFRRYVTL